MATFQDRFNILFDDSDLSQEEFGARVGASKFQVFNWRSGRGEPDSEMMKVIAKTFKVNSSWLLGETDVKTPFDLESATTPGEISPADLALIRKFKNLSPDKQKAIEILASDSEQSAAADK